MTNGDRSRWHVRGGTSIVVVALSTFVATPLLADGFSITTEINERVEVDNNIRLLPANSDWVFGSLTTPRIAFINESPKLDLGLDLGLEIAEYTGPGDDGTLDSLDQNLEATFEWRSLRSVLGTAATFDRTSVRSSEIEDTGQTGGQQPRTQTYFVLPRSATSTRALETATGRVIPNS